MKYLRLIKDENLCLGASCEKNKKEHLAWCFFVIDFLKFYF